MNDSLINGLKSNVARGFGIAEFWENTYKKKALPNLLKSWRMIDDGDAVSEMAWETVNAYTHYQKVDSEDIGIYSKIKMMVIPARTYKNKKGEEKTTAEQQVPAHYTHDGDYIGRVSDLGDERISYKMYIQITKRHFEFWRVGETLEDCFWVRDKDEFEKDGEFKTKDITKAERKAIKEAEKASAVARATAVIKRKKPVVAPVEELDEEDE
jgi:hypothetical protein